MAQYMHSADKVASGPILVQEYRKGSWDNTMAKTLEFVNTKLESKGQLIDVSLTMSNTDWCACIHIYYYKDVQTMKQFGRESKDYVSHGNIMCAWKRYKSSWGNAAKEMTETIEKMASTPGKLFGVKHACGNHAHTHGGAVIFVLYWDGIEALPTYKKQDAEGCENDSKQNYTIN